MEINEFTNITTQIAQNLNNQALCTQLLQQLNEDYQVIQPVGKTLQEQIEHHQKEIKTLQDTNMQLFLKVSNPKPPEVTDTQVPNTTYEDIIATLERR
jgi:hypothetical protein